MLPCQRITLGLHPPLEFRRAGKTEPIQKGSDVHLDGTFEVALGAPALELRDIALDDAGFRSQFTDAGDRVGRTEVAPKHVDRLVEHAARRFLGAVRPEERQQSLSQYAAVPGACE